MEKVKELDYIGWKILKELCKKSRTTNAEIGRRVGLSAPAVAERIRKMEEAGIIQGYSTYVDLNKIDLSIKALITYQVKSLNSSELKAFINSTPEVVEWCEITGPESVIIKVVVSKVTELVRLINELRKHGDTCTSMILSENRKLPIPEKIFTINAVNGFVNEVKKPVF